MCFIFELFSPGDFQYFAVESMKWKAYGGDSMRRMERALLG